MTKQITKQPLPSRKTINPNPPQEFINTIHNHIITTHNLNPINPPKDTKTRFHIKPSLYPATVIKKQNTPHRYTQLAIIYNPTYITILQTTKKSQAKQKTQTIQQIEYENPQLLQQIQQITKKFLKTQHYPRKHNLTTYLIDLQIKINQ